MADVHDSSGIARAVERQREMLQEADIPDRDREAIQKFVTHRKTHGSNSGSYALSTERDDYNKLRLSAERSSTPLVEMGIDEFNQFVQTLRNEYGITTGIDSYTRVLRLFYSWLNNHGEYGAYPWWEEIKTGNVEFKSPRDREFPEREEIDEMIRAAKQNNNPRNAALVSFYADSAVRRTLGAQLRVGDVDLDRDRPAFTPNSDGEAQKGVEIKPYPLYDSVADIRVWLNHYHPNPDNPDAPLWTTQTFDPEKPEQGALSVRRIGEILTNLAEQVGIDTDVVDVNPHAYRHAAVGWWKERGYTLTQVQRRTAWADSAAADLWGKYGDPDDDRIDAKIDELEGREPPEEEEEEQGPPERHNCGNCGERGILGDYCPSCGSPVAPAAQAVDMALDEWLADEKEAADSLERYKRLDRLESVLRKHPERLTEVEDILLDGE